MKNKIIHIDMDAFYVSVEIRDNPSLANKAVAVGGNRHSRSVLSTCNYIARQFGVRSAMPTNVALSKCPELIILPGRMSVYKQVSQQLHQILQRYTDKIEGLSLDEAYLDVTHCKVFEGSATLIAQDIRQAIYNELGLTASAGIAPLKYLAKIASDLNKPNGQYVIPPEQAIPFINTMRLNQISGVGKVSFGKLLEYGFEYGKDIRASNEALLIKNFGKLGQSLWLKCQGVDNRKIEVQRTRKSVGVETTLLHDVNKKNDVLHVLHKQLLPELIKRSEKHLHKSRIQQLTVKVKFYDFTLTTKSCQFSELDKGIFESLLLEVVEKSQGKPIRLVGIQLGLGKNKQQQLNLF